ncbi:MAG: hypothetical protein ABIR94_06960 [Rubrivivax sp.]
MRKQVLSIALAAATGTAMACPDAARSADAKSSLNPALSAVLSATPKAQPAKSEVSKKAVKPVEAKKPV